MFDKYADFREIQQLRKDHKQKQKMHYALVMMAVLGALLLVMVAIDEMAPTAKPAKAASTVSAISSAKQQETQDMQEIQDFATAVMKPLDQLTNEDLDVVEAKAGDPCFAENAKLPYELMVKTIEECKAK